MLNAIKSILNDPRLSDSHSQSLAMRPRPEIPPPKALHENENDRHDFRIWASNDLPPAPTPSPPVVPRLSTTQDGTHVLIVDDNKINLKVLQFFLSSLSYTDPCPIDFGYFHT